MKTIEELADETAIEICTKSNGGLIGFKECRGLIRKALAEEDRISCSRYSNKLTGVDEQYSLDVGDRSVDFLSLFARLD